MTVVNQAEYEAEMRRLAALETLINTTTARLAEDPTGAASLKAEVANHVGEERARIIINVGLARIRKRDDTYSRAI